LRRVAPAALPAGSANIWDTDLFEGSNVAGAGIPTGRWSVVLALHAAGTPWRTVPTPTGSRSSRRTTPPTRGATRARSTG
jgi:hypothetical protein